MNRLYEAGRAAGIRDYAMLCARETHNYMRSVHAAEARRMNWHYLMHLRLFKAKK